MHSKMMLVELFFLFFSTVEGAHRGILRNKPVLSSRCYHGHGKELGTDGKLNKGVILMKTNQPYFQVDLLEPYTLTAVIVSSYGNKWGKSLKGAHIGISKNGGSFVKCGTWPPRNLPRGKTLKFPCSFSGPVQFVKIWREGRSPLAFAEVDAEGKKFIPVLVQTFERTSFRRVQTSTPVSASSLVKCALVCHLHFCRTFSYNSQQVSCLIAESGLTVQDSAWNSWSGIV